MVVGRRSLPFGKLTFSGVVLNFGGVSYGRLKSEIFHGKNMIQNTQIDMIFLEIFGILQFSGGEDPKYPNVLLGWKIPPRTKRCSTNDPITKKVSVWFQCSSTWDINVVPPWNLKQLYSDIKFSKFQNPKRQVTSFQKTSGLLFFPVKLNPSTHLVTWCFSFLGLGSPRRMSFCFTGAT